MLVLPVKRKWFDMLLSGKKEEEYREVSPYWKTRFSKVFPMFPYSFIPEGNVVAPVLFRNGYRKDSPAFVAECVLEDIRGGRPEWGAEPGKEYYVLRVVRICLTYNIG